MDLGSCSFRFFLDRLPVQSLIRRIRAFRESFLAASSAQARGFRQGRVKDAYRPGSPGAARSGVSRAEAKATWLPRLARGPRRPSESRRPDGERPRGPASGQSSRREARDELWVKGFCAPLGGMGPSASPASPAAWPQGASYQDDSELSELPWLERACAAPGQRRGLGGEAAAAGPGAGEKRSSCTGPPAAPGASGLSVPPLWNSTLRHPSSFPSVLMSTRGLLRSSPGGAQAVLSFLP